MCSQNMQMGKATNPILSVIFFSLVFFVFWDNMNSRFENHKTWIAEGE